MISNSHGQLRSLVDRVLRLKAEQDAMTEDIKEVYAEAKANGFDKAQMGKVVNHLRKIEKSGGMQKIEEEEALFAIYLNAYHEAAQIAVDIPPAKEHARPPAHSGATHATINSNSADAPSIADAPAVLPPAAGLDAGTVDGPPVDVPASETFDPETGEITDDSDSPASSGAGGVGFAEPGEIHSAADRTWQSPPVPDVTLPSFLDRRQRAEVSS
jgi:uncharacterized protein (UPF0335 family)